MADITELEHPRSDGKSTFTYYTEGHWGSNGIVQVHPTDDGYAIRWTPDAPKTSMDPLQTAVVMANAFNKAQNKLVELMTNEIKEKVEQ